MDGGKELSYKDKVVAKPDTGDPSEPVVVGSGLPGATNKLDRTSPDATVAVQPLDPSDSVLRAVAPAGMKLSLVKDGVVPDTKTAAADGGAIFDVSNLYPRENVAVCSGDPSALTHDSCAATTVRNIRRDGEQFRAVVGFAQSGSSDANNSNKFFLDFYVSRPIYPHMIPGCGGGETFASPANLSMAHSLICRGKPEV